MTIDINGVLPENFFEASDVVQRAVAVAQRDLPVGVHHPAMPKSQYSQAEAGRRVLIVSFRTTLSEQEAIAVCEAMADRVTREVPELKQAFAHVSKP